MIQPQTYLTVADNTGAKKLCVFVFLEIINNTAVLVML
jgi:ribosomal protein L14